MAIGRRQNNERKFLGLLQGLEMGPLEEPEEIAEPDPNVVAQAIEAAAERKRAEFR